MKALMLIAHLSWIAVPLEHVAASEFEPELLVFPMDAYAGHFRETCLELQAGHTLVIGIESRYPVRLNVHHHLDTETLFLLDEVVDVDTSSIAIPSDGEYCLEVRNPENRASSYELRLTYRVSAG